jgi:parallel beta-helix repeat protein
VIKELGDYTVANDLVCASDAIQIAASEVTLFLAGHTVATSCAGCGFDGISVNPKGKLRGIRGVRIIGPGRIEGAASGVHFQGVQVSLVNGVVFINDFVGIKVDMDDAGNRSSNNRFTANAATDVGVGYYDVGGELDQYLGNSATETGATITGGYGFAILSSRNTLTGNEVTRNYAGMAVENSNNNIISANRISGNAQVGILLTGSSSGNQIVSNSATSNGTDLLDPEGTCTRNRWRFNAFVKANAVCVQ